MSKPVLAVSSSRLAPIMAPPSTLERAAFLPMPPARGLLARSAASFPVPSAAATAAAAVAAPASFLRLLPATRQHAHNQGGEGQQGSDTRRGSSNSNADGNSHSHPSSAQAEEPTSPPRRAAGPVASSGGGAQWRKLLMYALVALPNLWWAPAPFLPPAPPSSSTSRDAAAVATRATAATAFLGRVGLAAPGAEAAAGLSDEQQLVAVSFVCLYLCAYV